MTDLGTRLESPGVRLVRHAYRSWEEGCEARPAQVLVLQSYATREALAAFCPSETRIAVDHHTRVPAWRIRLPRKTFAQQQAALRAVLVELLGNHELLFAECEVGKRVLPLILSKRFKGIVDQQEVHDARKNDRQLVYELIGSITEECGPILDRLAQIMARNVHLHFSSTRATVPGDADGTLHIFTDMSPSGELGVASVSPFLCGRHIRVDGSNVQFHGFARGRGGLVMDPVLEGIVAAQVVEGHWYLLFPFISHFNRATTPVILEAILAEIWGQCLLGKDALERLPLTKEAFAQGYRKIFQTFCAYYEERLATLRERVATRQREFMDDLLLLRQMTGVVQSLQRGYAAEDDSSVVETQWSFLHNNASRIVRQEIVAEGIHVYTQEIHVAHEGRVYNLGSFVIRYSWANASVTVWSFKGTHPRGVIHPHIPRTGTPCFGNATMAIAEAAGSMNVGSVVAMVLQWLEYGYDASVADHPIAEWPLIEGGAS